jgi:hypothetical protein
VIVEPDACQAPFGELVIARRQSVQRRPLDACEQIAPAQPEAPHDMSVHAFENEHDCAIGFGE